MKLRPLPTRPIHRAGDRAGRPVASCSLLVLAALGVLCSSLPQAARAQAAGGVAANALPVLRGVVSGQAVVNAPTVGATRSLMTIDQQSQRAILDWRSFNIGSDSEVLFRQPNSAASALNRIYDANPSVIQGKLTANGQILLINQNGILFDRGTQVNVQSLVASTLNLSNERYLSGALAGGGLSTPAFAGGYDGSGVTTSLRPDGSLPGSIDIGKSGAASAAAPTLSAQAGGSVLLVATSIDNQSGVIRAPDGQVLLAAGSKAYLALSDSANDITLRGFVVEVEAARGSPSLNLSNLIRNAGDIGADRGNVSLAALAINQEGRISAKTAVQNNGSVYLTARARTDSVVGAAADARTYQAGVATFKAGSVTEVVPDLADKTTVPDAQYFAPYRGVIQVNAGTINSAGSLRAPGGRIQLNAADASDPQAARVYLEAGSETSVAGVWADVDAQKNLQTFRVTSNELRNAPDQRNGVLRGATVTVDLRQGNSILELQGYRDIVARTVAEKAAAGGELQIASTGAVVQRSGAVIDASGGGYRYGDATITTSRLLGADGRIYDIANAPQDRAYTQLLDTYQRTDARWGQTVSVANPLGSIGVFQDAYVQGLSGGTVSITSGAGMVLDGTLQGGVTIGSRQWDAAPRAATLRIGDFLAAARTFPESQRIGNMSWQQRAADTLGAGFTPSSMLSTAQRNSFTLASSQVFGPARRTGDGLVESAFGSVELNINGRLSVPSNVSIDSGVGGSLTLRSPQIEIAGDINLPGGKLTLRPVVPGGPPISPELATVTERVIVRSGADLSTAGAWINRSGADGSFTGLPAPSSRLNLDGSVGPRSIDGGTITIQLDSPAYQTRLEGGASLDVGGGAAIDSARRITAGRGGSLSIANGVQNQSTSDWLRADLRGFAIAGGGELNLSLAKAVIDSDDANGVLPAGTTRLGTGLFSDLGFSRVNLVAADGIEIVPGTALTVQQKNLVVDAAAAIGLPTGAALSSISTVALLPDSQRSAASINLSAPGGGRPGEGVLSLGPNASITTDARGDVSLSAVNGLIIDGAIRAPGGRVNLTLNGPTATRAPDLRIGIGADISTAGVFVATPNDRGLALGSLVSGGTVTIDARNSGLDIDSGARIDVSGVNASVDIPTSDEQPSFLRQTQQGHAGTLILKSQGRTALDGAFIGRGGSAEAAGGSFALELRRPDGQVTLPDERRIVVTPARNRVPAEPGFVDATINVDELMARGFEKLRLQSENRIAFQGAVTLDFARGIRLDAPLIDLNDGARVLLRGSNVALGQSLGARQRVTGGDQPTWQLNEGTASPALATRVGDGTLTASASVADLYGNLTVNGARLVRIESDSDIRLVGRSVNLDSQAGGQAVSRQIGSLTTAGSIELVSAQVYPATRTEYTFSVKPPPGAAADPAAAIRNASNGNAPGTVYSAGGKVTLEAPTIEQSGALKAPLGEIDLRATRLLNLAAGSVTSVSGTGVTVPYGTTLSGILWRYVDGSAPASTLAAVTDEGKRITLDAPLIDVKAGATVDLRGGGDVLAVEFVPGNGGDRDITLQDNTFAIVPAARLRATPYDRYTQSLRDSGVGFALDNGRDAALYDSIQIGAGGAVPAGEYSLLPARYALLPDAYLVQLQTGSAYRRLQPGQTATLPNGDVVLAGFRSAQGTTVLESQSVGVVVKPGSAARQASDYNLTGSTFFADAAALERAAPPRAPWDAGRLSVDNATALALNGTVEAAATRTPVGASGRIAEVDIAGRSIAVVDRIDDGSVPSRFLQLEGAALSRLDASVLLGGKRDDTDTGVRITTSANEVLVANSSAGAVQLPELVLAARNVIDVRSGSVLAARGAPGDVTTSVIGSETTGALVRLSTGGQARVDRGQAGAGAGDVRIADGASLSADASVLIDATRSTESRGVLRAGGNGGVGGALSLSSGQVSVGDTTNAAGALAGLVLSNADLASFGALDALVLRGYSGISLIGTTTLGSSSLSRLSLDTPLLNGQTTANGSLPRATVAARTVELSNDSNVTAASTVGEGSLNIEADRLVLDAGAKAIRGFSTTRLAASDTLVSGGKGSLSVAGALEIDTPRVLALGGSEQTLRAVDNSLAGTSVYSPLTLTASSAATVAANQASTELGGRLTLEGSSVTVATVVEARSGQITLAARGVGVNDGVTLASGALINATGQAKDFNGTSVTADGGAVSLLAVAGSIDVQAGAKVDVSAAAQGGRAGRIEMDASALSLAGELVGRAGAGARSGSITLDVRELSDFSALNLALNAGGFAEDRHVRVRAGNIIVAAADEVRARRVGLTADTGDISVAGSIGTGAPNGGARIELNAAGDINLAPGSTILANGSQAGARGGEVRIASVGGAVLFDAASSIDVRAGDAGGVGSVVFGVGRDDNDVMGSARLEGTVRRWSAAGLAARMAGDANGDRPASVDLEVTRRYSVGARVEASDIEAFGADHAAFVATHGSSAAAAAVTGALRDEGGPLLGARVLGATELRRAGDLILATPWDLTGEPWLAGAQPGTLTLRAGGNLTVSQSIGSPNDNVLSGDTWNLRLVAGADLAAANPLDAQRVQALPAGKGTLRLSGAEAKLRTGTGRIDLSAGADLVLDNPAAVIYTAGRIGAPDTNPDGRDRWTIDGGGISVQAGGSVTGAASSNGDLWINEWLRRPRERTSQFAALQSTDWWSLRTRFQQGVATLGGGDIDIVAGADITNLAAMLPTSGRTYRDAEGVRRVDVQGGGDLNVRSGGNLSGGNFLVARGDGHIEAAGDVGSSRRTQLYVMGASSGVVAERASIDLVAGGSLALQSVSNPTAMSVPLVDFDFDNEDAVFDPSFGNSGNFSTFFSYSANSQVGAFAKSGDLSYAAVLAPRWRTLDASNRINSLQTDNPGAFPASLSFVAFDGNLSGPQRLDAITTFPSTQAHVSMLAGQSLLGVGLYASDLNPASVITPTTSFSRANDFAAGQIDGRTGLQPLPGQPRIVSRQTQGPFAFELQALEGSLLTGGTSSSIVLTAASQVRAGVDIVGARLLLQNLEPTDTSVVRADTGDIRQPQAIAIGGPGRLLLQAGRNIDLGSASSQGPSGNIGGLVATGTLTNSRLRFDQSARITVVAGVTGTIDLSRMDSAYAEIVRLNSASGEIIDLYQQLGADPNTQALLQARNVADLALRDPTYSRLVSLDVRAPRALRVYQDALRASTLPLGPTPESAAATALYRLLNAEPDLLKLQSASSVADLALRPGGSALSAFVDLDARYPLVFKDYVQRRSQGALPTGLTPIVFSSALAEVIATVVAPSTVTGGSISSYQTSIQTYGGSDIDLWAPGGSVVVGLTTPRADRTVGVLTNAGGAVRSVLSGDFDINQGKLLTVQGGDILVFSSQGSIDAGRGAKTSLSTPAPTRTPVFETIGGQQVQVGVLLSIPTSAAGSGIQTLSSDPDGPGPLTAAKPGDVFLFAPAGTIDAGEAGIRSSGNILINAQTVLNASNISVAGASAGVPVATVGSLASSLASGGTTTSNTAKAGEDPTNASAGAARAAAAAQLAKPTILVVEVLGFGDKNCKEQDKDCFAK